MPLKRIFIRSGLRHDRFGSALSVRVTGPAFGQSMRLLVDWTDPDATSLVIPLGVSGHLGSPHRLDQLEDGLKGDPAGSRTRLHPSAVGKELIFTPR